MTLSDPNASSDPAPALLSQPTPASTTSSTVDEASPSTAIPTPFAGLISKATAPAEPVRTGKHLATQTEYPWRNSLVNGAVTTVASLAAISAALADPTVQSLVNTYIPGQAATVFAVGVFLGAVVTALHRVVNIPAVAGLLTRLHLGPVPKN